MNYKHPDALVSTEWLAEHLTDSGVRIFDGTSHLPTVPRDAEAEYLEKHIPGAQRFDIEDISDHANPLPHMLPSSEAFAEKVGALGVSNDHRVIVYDAYGMQSAARVWWMFRVFGHDNVAVLNGGLPKWIREHRPLAGGRETKPAETFKAIFRPELVTDVDALLGNLPTQRVQVLDARAAERFQGTAPEPRAGLRAGHIPGSRSVPFTEILEPDRTVPDAATLHRRLVEEARVDLDRPIATTCGSGVTACVLALGLYLLGKEDVAVYDGSWTEWGGHPKTPVETS